MKKLFVLIIIVGILLTGCLQNKEESRDDFVNDIVVKPIEVVPIQVITSDVIYEEIIEENVIYENVIEENVIYEEVIPEETTWISDEYKAETEYNSRRNNYGTITKGQQ